MKSKLIYILQLLIGLFVLGCSNDTPGNQDPAMPDPVVAVQVAPVEQRTMPENLTVDGVTEVRDRETVISPIDGTILKLYAEVGDSVDDGDTLAIIRTKNSEAAISGAQRLLSEASAPNQRAEAEKMMQIAEDNEQIVPVTAGLSGVVTERMVSSGQAVAAYADMFQVVDLATLDFMANVPLKDLPNVNVGQACHIRFPALPDQNFSGEIVSISARSDRGSQTTPVRIGFRSGASGSILRVGMAGTAEIAIDAHPKVLVVPTVALLRDDINQTYTIYTVGADSLARAIPVTTGIVNDSLAEVSSPSLHPGDLVIVKGNYEVSDSTRVKIESGRTR